MGAVASSATKSFDEKVIEIDYPASLNKQSDGPASALAKAGIRQNLLFSLILQKAWGLAQPPTYTPPMLRPANGSGARVGPQPGGGSPFSRVQYEKPITKPDHPKDASGNPLTGVWRPAVQCGERATLCQVWFFMPLPPPGYSYDGPPGGQWCSPQGCPRATTSGTYSRPDTHIDNLAAKQIFENGLRQLKNVSDSDPNIRVWTLPNQEPCSAELNNIDFAKSQGSGPTTSECLALQHCLMRVFGNWKKACDNFLWENKRSVLENLPKGQYDIIRSLFNAPNPYSAFLNSRLEYHPAYHSMRQYFSYLDSFMGACYEKFLAGAKDKIRNIMWENKCNVDESWRAPRSPRQTRRNLKGRN